MAVKYPCCGDIEALQVPQKLIDLQAMADLSEISAKNYTAALQRNAHSMILLAMIVVCLSFVAMFSIPMGLQNLQGCEAAQETMSGFRFRVFVIFDAVGFFSSLGAVAVLIFIQARGARDVDLLMICGTAIYVAAGCASVAFVAGASTFWKPPGWFYF